MQCVTTNHSFFQTIQTACEFGDIEMHLKQHYLKLILIAIWCASHCRQRKQFTETEGLEDPSLCRRCVCFWNRWNCVHQWFIMSLAHLSEIQIEAHAGSEGTKKPVVIISACMHMPSTFQWSRDLSGFFRAQISNGKYGVPQCRWLLQLAYLFSISL